jgi:hypothetical protein
MVLFPSTPLFSQSSIDNLRQNFQNSPANAKTNDAIVVVRYRRRKTRTPQRARANESRWHKRHRTSLRLSPGPRRPQPTLIDWIANPDTKLYSGEAVYTRDFTLATLPTKPVLLEIEGSTAISPNPDPARSHPRYSQPPRPSHRTGHASLVRPPFEAANRLYQWKASRLPLDPLYRLDVTYLLKPGSNHIEIRVYNTAINAWATLPPHDYKPLIAKFGDRF